MVTEYLDSLPVLAFQANSAFNQGDKHRLDRMLPGVVGPFWLQPRCSIP
jgi:hypothetical protein